MSLTLSRPERGNALSAEVVEELLRHVMMASADQTIHRLKLCASGPHFCTGLDLSGFEEGSDGDLLHRLVRIEILLSALWHAPMQTVAIAQGRAWGAGADLFAACEARVALPNATFRFPGALFGVVLGTRRLAVHVGADVARQVVTEGRQLDARQALEAGLATHASEPSWTEPVVTPATARALRKATRLDMSDCDLAALVRSAAEPGLKLRIAEYSNRVRLQLKQAPD